ncbi:MAG TPA: EAL domain-containing protein [Acidiferrobacterales bacterium]
MHDAGTPRNDSGRQAAPAAVRRPRNWHDRLGIHSLLGRYVYSAVLFVVGLGAAAWLANHYVGGAAATNAVNLADRQEISQRVRDLGNDLWYIENSLHGYLLVPTAAARETVLGEIDDLTRNTQRLADDVQVLSLIRIDARRFVRQAKVMRSRVAELLDVRADPVKLFPAMTIMMDAMQPGADEIISLTSLSMDEARDRGDDPVQAEIYRLFADIRYSWVRIIGAFRLYVANRFGIFSVTPEVGMRAQASVVGLFAERVDLNMKRLEELAAQNRLEFQQSDALPRIRVQHRKWFEAYRQVMRIYSSDRWRSDVPLLRDHVQPLFVGLWETLREIEQSVAWDSASDIAATTRVADKISTSLWLLVVFGAGLAVLGVLIFELQIRRPIARVARALRAEAAGDTDTGLPKTDLQETQDLIQAFDAMRAQVHTRQEHLQAVLTYAVEAIVTIDDSNRIETFNPAAEKLFGRSAAAIVGEPLSVLVPAFSRFQGERSGGAGEVAMLDYEHEELARREDGSLLPVSLKVSEMFVQGRRLYLCMMADISEQKQMQQQREDMLVEIRSREQRIRAILDNTAEGIITCDHRGHIEDLNQAAERLFGWAEDELIGTSMSQIVLPDNPEMRDGYLQHLIRNEIQRLVGHEGELVGRRKDGTLFPMAIKISEVELEGQRKYIALVANISERKTMMEHLRRLAEHDGLTGLYNRTYFLTELERAVARVQRNEQVTCALLYIDLDHFKYINDTMGHAAGDRLLIEVAGIFTRRARKSDLVVRLGGDEFTILAFDVTTDAVHKLAESFRKQIAGYRFLHDGKAVDVGCSIGVAVIDKQTQSPAEAMSQADVACHLAKRAGRNRIHVFDPADAKDVNTMSLDMGWSHRIKEAIAHDRFVLARQPIVRIGTREVTGYEILIRMLDERDEIIMPGGFLPTAERFGLSVDIDRWVISRSIEKLAAERIAEPTLQYTINLSAQTLTSRGIIEIITEKLADTGLDPRALTFEVTETAAIADMNTAVTFLSNLQSLGCHTALDDFGSGMSSFAYLRDLPVDIVKIDGRFVKNLPHSPVDQAMVRAMNDIAHALGKQTVAEFVGDEACVGILAGIGVDYGQGFHLGKPEFIQPLAHNAGGASRRSAS